MEIGKGEKFVDPDYEDAIESQALYNVLSDKFLVFMTGKMGMLPGYG